jgi:methylated-DNA-[protein]-cysteine S-methyltransferase
MNMYYSRYTAPFGELLLAGDEEGLKYIGFPEGKGHLDPDPDWQNNDEFFSKVRLQLTEYFAGSRKEFELKLAPHGTRFQLEVMSALQRIPYGETMSYVELARAVGRPRASRAVGAANGRNPLPIVVPCHRVIGADGSLTGFGGGLPIKQFLLEHEGVLQKQVIAQKTLALT